MSTTPTPSASPDTDTNASSAEPEVTDEAAQDPGPRRAGVLLPLFSIRATGGGWGLGEIPDIPRFARWARSAGLSVLQLLPVNEVAGGESSPYAAASAFALDPVYLGLEDLEDFAAVGGRASLDDQDRARLESVSASPTVMWAAVRALKQRAIWRAFLHFRATEWQTGSERRRALERFIEQHRDWLKDHALFRALHDRHHKAWWDWPDPLKRRDPGALEHERQALGDAVLMREWLQWQLDEQWHRARAEAGALGVALKGDLPFMVGGDSSDVWSRPDDFQLDRRVGTPPDAFSATGQDWGLPAYDWEAMHRSNYAWLEQRAARSGSLYDMYRVDHVIGLYRTWTRAADDPEDAGFSPAKERDQIALGETVLRIFARHGKVVAEDLGMVPEFLPPSLKKLQIPGYRVLRWEKVSDHKFKNPAKWPALSVSTNGTHDVEPNAAWYPALPAPERAALLALPGLKHLDPDQGRFTPEVRDALLRVVYQAPSVLTVNPFQDLLGGDERINLPGTVADTNWCYRMPLDLGALDADRATRERLAALAAESRRT
jgi:4-alpha-glucanotransferase